MPITLNGTTGITTPADTVTGNATVGGTLDVTGASTLAGGATIGGVAAVAVAPGTNGNVLTSNGTIWTSAAPTSGGAPSAIGQIPFSTNGSTYAATQKIVQGTTVASTSGVNIDFTSIPSWVKRITVMLNNVSTNGTSALVCQIGTSGGIANSGYNSGASNIATTVTSTAYANGFGLNSGSVASESLSGVITIAYMGSNLWACGSSIVSSFPGTRVGGGSVTLSGTLDRVRIATNNGTDTFDAGSINILYE